MSRLHPEDVPKAQAARQAHFEQNIPYQVEFRLRTKDESYSWFLARGQAERDDSGEITRMSGTISDISARKVAEQALEQSEQRFREVFELAAVGIAVIDTPTGRHLSVNQRMCEINHRSRESLQAQIADPLPPIARGTHDPRYTPFESEQALRRLDPWS